MARGGLTKWFAEKWVDLSRPIYDEDGALVGFEPCGRHKAHEGPQGGAKHYPKCRPLREAMRMTERQRQDAIKRKRKVERKAEREGKAGPGSKAKMVSTYRDNPSRKPPHPPLPLRQQDTFELTAMPVQQGLFSPSAYEKKPAPREEPVEDERQLDMFGMPIEPSKKIRENKAEHVYIRRTPVLSHKEGTKRKHHYWYTYDKNEAKKVKVKAKVGEKIKIPHNGQQGHYEVIGRLSDDVVGMIHDETHHAMAISDEALRELLKDVYHPDENLLPSEDVRYRHEKEDALPSSRDSAYRAIQEASGIEDHDFAQADQEYREWKRNKGKKRKRPAPWRGGGLDIFETDLPRNKHFSCLLEAFEHATKGATTWRDIEPVLKMLHDVPGFENARFPDEVYERHVKHEAELEQQGYTIDVTLYGHTYSGLEGEDIKEVIFMASTIIPPGLQKGSGAEEAIGARDEGAVEDDMEEWGF